MNDKIIPDCRGRFCRTHYGLAAMDVASGRFIVNQFTKQETLAAELQRLNPAELLYSETFQNLIN